MKNILKTTALVSSLLVASAAMAADAPAANNGFFVKLSAGYVQGAKLDVLSKMDNKHTATIDGFAKYNFSKDGETALTEANTVYVTNTKNKRGKFGFGAELGFKMNDTFAFGLEFRSQPKNEVSYTTFATKTTADAQTGNETATPKFKRAQETTFKASSNLFLAKGYFMMPVSEEVMLKPYIGVGVGLANNSLKLYNATDSTAQPATNAAIPAANARTFGTRTEDTNLKSSSTSLAFGFDAGVMVPVDDNINVTLAYSYANAGKAKVFGSKDMKVSLDSHSFMAGVMLSF
jgi:opacity protein-like surface antigen